MKKKIFLSFVISIMFALILTFTVLADTVHNENTVDYNATATLSDGTVLNIFDSEGNALTWYISGKDGDKNIYSSIRTDDSQVRWHTESWGEVTGLDILLTDGTSYSGNSFVVVNMMDDDVVSNYAKGNHTNIGKPITGFKYVFQGWKNLEYVYLRLDVTGIYRQSFNGCSKLKYVNVGDLTLLTRLGDSQHFSNCSEFFKGETLDLSKTALKRIDGGGSFNNVHFTKIIFPSTLTEIGSWSFQSTSFVEFSWPVTVTTIENSMFKNNSSLKTVYLNSSLKKIGDEAFIGCTSLEKICFVGTLDELNALLANTSTTNNDPFWAVVGENNANVISYEDYKKLTDKSGKYVIYNYSYCEAYNEGVHTVGEPMTNNCVGTCTVCGETVVCHNEETNITVTMVYTNFGIAGEKITTCNNEGCNHKETVSIPALFECLGYSTREDGSSGIAVGFKVNYDMINEYTTITNKTVSYGIFAALQDKIGDNYVLDGEGNLTCQGVKAEISGYEYSTVELKINGFETEQQKTVKIAMGIYVETSDDEATEYSYVQAYNPLENDKYSFVSFNDILNS